MISKNNQIKEHYEKVRREKIKENLLDCLKDINDKININTVIKKHKKYIETQNLLGKSKYKTLELLIHYKNTNNKQIAINNLICAMVNLKLFRLIDEV